MSTPRNEHEAVMEALDNDQPEILNESEGLAHIIADGEFEPEEVLFTNEFNNYFEEV